MPAGKTENQMPFGRHTYTGGKTERDGRRVDERDRGSWIEYMKKPFNFVHSQAKHTAHIKHRQTQTHTDSRKRMTKCEFESWPPEAR